MIPDSYITDVKCCATCHHCVSGMPFLYDYETYYFCDIDDIDDLFGIKNIPLLMGLQVEPFGICDKYIKKGIAK